VKALQIEPQVQDLLVYGGLASLGCVLVAVTLPVIEKQLPPPVPPPPQKPHFKWRIYVTVQYVGAEKKQHAMEVAAAYFATIYRPYSYRIVEERYTKRVMLNIFKTGFTVEAELWFGDMTTYWSLKPVWEDDVYYHEYPHIALTDDKPPEVSPA